jgi:hypothetical protein
LRLLIQLLDIEIWRQFLPRGLKAPLVPGRQADAQQHGGRLRPRVAVVEQRDVPIGLQGGEEAAEGAGPLGELDDVYALVGDVAAEGAGASAHQVPEVDLSL